MKYIGYSFAFVCVWLLPTACNRQNIYEQKAKTLDSLSGALNAAVKELRVPDTVLLQKALERFSHYRQFIAQNVTDTVSKTEADALKRFYESGRKLEDFSGNRGSVLARTSLVNSQINGLRTDAMTRSLESEQLIKFTEQEMTEANALIEIAGQQKKSYYSALEEFRSSLAGVEDLIRKRNNGELPAIVKDPSAL